MSICFDNYKEGAALLLRIILDRDDITVTEIKTQKELKNLQGRDIWLEFMPLTNRASNTTLRSSVQIYHIDRIIR